MMMTVVVMMMMMVLYAILIKEEKYWHSDKKVTSLFSSMSSYRTVAYYADCFQVPHIIFKLF